MSMERDPNKPQMARRTGGRPQDPTGYDADDEGQYKGEGEGDDEEEEGEDEGEEEEVDDEEGEEEEGNEEL